MPQASQNSTDSVGGGGTLQSGPRHNVFIMAKVLLFWDGSASQPFAHIPPAYQVTPSPGLM
jgi:hypothetical protein